MTWKVGTAKQRFSEVIRRAETTPQIIRNRGRVVAAVVGPAEAERLEKHGTPGGRTMADDLAELRRICEEESFSLEVPPRTNRPNPFAPEPRRARRHQRRK